MSSPKIIISDTPHPTSSLLTLLNFHLPYSLPVLRRIQFAQNFAKGSSANTHILHVYPEGSSPDGHFAAAYVDLSRGPETQVWLYSTLEDGCSSAVDLSNMSPHDLLDQDALSLCDELLSTLLRRIRTIYQNYAELCSTSSSINGNQDDNNNINNNKNNKSDSSSSSWVLFGTIHEATRQRLLVLPPGKPTRMKSTPNVPEDLEWEFCGKWLFRIEDLIRQQQQQQQQQEQEQTEVLLPLQDKNLVWDVLRTKEDVRLVQSRTAIQRTEETLKKIPSVMIRLKDEGTPIAWAFMGYDGTLMTLHVEEHYRRMGLAKAVACKVMRDHLAKYGDDGWGAADVFVENDKSQALCKSIGGKMRWTLSWALIDISSVGEPL